MHACIYTEMLMKYSVFESPPLYRKDDFASLWLKWFLWLRMDSVDNLYHKACAFNKSVGKLETMEDHNQILKIHTDKLARFKNKRLYGFYYK